MFRLYPMLFAAAILGNAALADDASDCPVILPKVCDDLERDYSFDIAPDTATEFYVYSFDTPVYFASTFVGQTIISLELTYSFICGHAPLLVKFGKRSFYTCKTNKEDNSEFRDLGIYQFSKDAGRLTKAWPKVMDVGVLGKQPGQGLKTAPSGLTESSRIPSERVSIALYCRIARLEAQRICELHQRDQQNAELKNQIEELKRNISELKTEGARR